MSDQASPASLSAVILAGGLGTRLRSIVGTAPKVLAPIRGVPFIDYLLGYLRLSGMHHVVLCTGYGAEHVRAYCGDGRRFGVQIDYSQELQPLGTGGALRQAARLVRSNPVLVLNGDSLVRANVSEFLAFHQRQAAVISLALVDVPERSRFGSVLLQPDNAISGFVEKGKSGAGWINAGMYLVVAAALHAMPTSQPLSLEEEIFPSYVGGGLCGYATGAAYMDIGTPAAWHDAETMLTDSFDDLLAPKGATR